MICDTYKFIRMLVQQQAVNYGMELVYHML